MQSTKSWEILGYQQLDIFLSFERSSYPTSSDQLLLTGKKSILQINRHTVVHFLAATT